MRERGGRDIMKRIHYVRMGIAIQQKAVLDDGGRKFWADFEIKVQNCHSSLVGVTVGDESDPEVDILL